MRSRMGSGSFCLAVPLGLDRLVAIFAQTGFPCSLEAPEKRGKSSRKKDSNCCAGYGNFGRDAKVSVQTISGCGGTSNVVSDRPLCRYLWLHGIQLELHPEGSGAS